MKSYESFFLSFLASLLMGAFLFIGIPLVWEIVTMPQKEIFSMEYDMVFIGVVMYVVYAVIQFWLSSANFVQTRYWWVDGHLNIAPKQMLYKFLIAEGVLYLIVFIAFAIPFGGGEEIFVVSLFSIPYIICCTASVFTYRNIFLKLNQPQSHENVEEV
jgi:hypothetical protein